MTTSRRPASIARRMICAQVSTGMVRASICACVRPEWACSLVATGPEETTSTSSASRRSNRKQSQNPCVACLAGCSRRHWERESSPSADYRARTARRTRTKEASAGHPARCARGPRSGQGFFRLHHLSSAAAESAFGSTATIADAGPFALVDGQPLLQLLSCGHGRFSHPRRFPYRPNDRCRHPLRRCARTISAVRLFNVLHAAVRRPRCPEAGRSYQPESIYNGDIADTPALEAWVIATAVPAAAR
jgi:hypothetical protein